MFRWSHGHNIAAGVLAGVLIGRRDTWLVVGVPLVAGIAIGRAWSFAAALSQHWLSRRRVSRIVR